MRYLKLAFAVTGLALLLAGCGYNSTEYFDVPPNYIGLILAPSGYDQKIYEPGQVDLGGTNQSGYANKLVLIQQSGFAIKEQFLRNDPNNAKDPEDHRCVVGPSLQPMAVDMRLLFALPDYKTDEGAKDIIRLAHLGNPEATKDKPRVLVLDAASVYAEQAQQQVRGKIRQTCASFDDVASVFKTLASQGDDSFSVKAKKAVAAALVDTKVPLHLVEAVVSNVKPDPTVIDATVRKQAAEEQVKAIQVVTDFLDKDPSGNRQLVYKLQAIQEIMAKGDEKGRSAVYMMDLQGGGPRVVPVPQR